jgi:hypothetical protein
MADILKNVFIPVEPRVGEKIEKIELLQQKLQVLIEKKVNLLKSKLPKYTE